MVTAAVAGSAAYSQLNTTSSAVNGLPSCQRTFGLSFQVTDRPSRDRPSFSVSGISAANIGSRLPSRGPKKAWMLAEERHREYRLFAAMTASFSDRNTAATGADTTSGR